MAKMWAGRTDGKTEQLADDFNSSIRFDRRMFRQDITGSMAHAAMLGARGIITREEADALIARTAAALAPGRTVYYTGHCTGDHAFERLKEVLGDRLCRITGGQGFEI